MSLQFVTVFGAGWNKIIKISWLYRSRSIIITLSQRIGFRESRYYSKVADSCTRRRYNCNRLSWAGQTYFYSQRSVPGAYPGKTPGTLPGKTPGSLFPCMVKPHAAEWCRSQYMYIIIVKLSPKYSPERWNHWTFGVGSTKAWDTTDCHHNSWLFGCTNLSAMHCTIVLLHGTQCLLQPRMQWIQ